MRLETTIGNDDSERRLASGERRAKLWWSFAYGSLHPRRRGGRRSEDQARPIIDWHSPLLLVGSIAVLLLCIADALLTLRLVALGAIESNPLMAPLLRGNVQVFATAKLGITGVGVLLLVAIARFKVFGILRVAGVLYALLLAYLGLILYELSLLPPSG